MSTIRTVLADEQKLFVEGLNLLLGEIKSPSFNVIEMIFSGKDLKKNLKNYSLDLIFLELNFSDIDGLELISWIKEFNSKIKVCVLTNYKDPKLVKASFQNGADGYLLKTSNSEHLLECVESLMTGDRFLSKGLYITPPKREIDEINGEIESRNYEDNFMLKQKLTKRELEVLRLIVDAKNNKEIAQELFISDQTVGVHRKNIMRKLGVKNTISLIKFAFEHSLV